MRVLILAAGKGKRLNADKEALPKVLHLLREKPLIHYVTEKLTGIPKQDICIVVGFKKELVIAEMPGYAFAEQREQLGTGHAVMAAEDFLKNYDGDVLVLYGDMPMFREETYRRLMETHINSNADVTLLTCNCTDRHLSYGRVLRDKNGKLLNIVEERDCTRQQAKITELNVGVYVFRVQPMLHYLKSLRCNNAQREYYLTDLPKIMQEHNCILTTYTITDTTEVIGINTKEDLAVCEEILRV